MLNDYLTLEQAQWMEGKIKQASYVCEAHPTVDGVPVFTAGIPLSGSTVACKACNNTGRIFYTSMTDYLERHGGAWPSGVV